MEIRLGMQEDFDKYIPVKEEFIIDYGISEKSREFILKEFKEYLNNAIIFAIENGRIIGYLAGKNKVNLYERYGHISEIFVKRDYRGKGISTQLKNKYIRFLKRKGITICRIEVNPDNPSQEIYKKWGFKIDKNRMSLKIK